MQPTTWRRTIRSEQIAVVNGDTEDVFIEVLDRELHRRIPFRIERIRHNLRSMLLHAHAHLAVRVALACNHYLKWTQFEILPEYFIIRSVLCG